MKCVSLSLNDEELRVITRLVLREAFSYSECPKVVSDLTDVLYLAKKRLDENGLEVFETSECSITERAFQALIRFK